MWDMETGNCIYTLAIEDVIVSETGPVDAGVTSVVMSPDGQYLAAGSLDTIVRIWDAQTGQLLDKLKGHKDSVYSVAFSPDGKFLVSGSLDKTLKMWDMTSLEASLKAGVPGVSGNGKDIGEGGKTFCMTTLQGHKVSPLSLVFVRLERAVDSISCVTNDRTTFSRLISHRMGPGSSRDPKIVVSSSGTRKRPRPNSCFRDTRIQVRLHFVSLSLIKYPADVWRTLQSSPLLFLTSEDWWRREVGIGRRGFGRIPYARIEGRLGSDVAYWSRAAVCQLLLPFLLCFFFLFFKGLLWAVLLFFSLLSQPRFFAILYW